MVGGDGVLRGRRRSPTFGMPHPKLLRLAEAEVERTLEKLPPEVREAAGECVVSFEDIVIFVHDMDTALARLNPFHQRLIAMNILEDYSLPEVARLLTCPLRTVEREVPDALDVLSLAFIESGLIKQA